MRILVDADACPVVTIVEHTAKKYQIPVILLCDTNHVLQSGYSEVLTIGAGTDAVDFKLVSICRKGGSAKRTVEDDIRFEESLEKLIQKCQRKQEL